MYKHVFLARVRATKSVYEDWAAYYEHFQTDVEREVCDVDIYDRALVDIILSCYSPGNLVLEAGCGSGRLCFWLSKKRIKSVGVDFISGMVRRAHDYAKKKNSPASFAISSVLDLPLKSNSFDGYISLGIIEHFRSEEEVIQVLKECERVLKPGGIALISVPNIFVPFANRLLLWLSRERMGRFHRFYKINDLRRLGRMISCHIRVEVVNIWLPPYNFFANMLEKIKLTLLLRSMGIVFTKMPSLPFMKHFLGYICIIAVKPLSGTTWKQGTNANYVLQEPV